MSVYSREARREHARLAVQRRERLAEQRRERRAARLTQQRITAAVQADRPQRQRKPRRGPVALLADRPGLELPMWIVSASSPAAAAN